MLSMSPIISVANLSKTYGSGFKALNGVNLDINRDRKAAARSQSAGQTIDYLFFAGFLAGAPFAAAAFGGSA